MEYACKILACDFEFNRTSHPLVHNVAVSIRPYGAVWDANGDSGRLYPQADATTFWLCDSDEESYMAREAFRDYHSDGYIILSFGGIAEARALASLGLRPEDYVMVDLYVMWLQLKHTWRKYQYGKFIGVDGKIHESEPPRFDRMNGAKLPGIHNQLGNSLSACVAALLGRVIDTDHKDKIRNLIISDPAEWTEDEIRAISEYNESDILYLPELFLKMMDAYVNATNLEYDTALKVFLQHGEYVKSQARAEDEGIPVDLPRLKNLGANYDLVKEKLITDLIKVYPFFERAEPSKGSMVGKWIEKSSRFQEYLVSRGLDKIWPRTEATSRNPEGCFKSDEDTLEAYEGQYPELRQLRQVRKSIDQIIRFDPMKDGNILKYVGPDGRIRTWLAPFGTLTGRNAPLPSKGYIPAMAKWLRSLINPPEGWVIIEFDWSSQEFLIAASLSGDKAMKDAYISGDPYLYFAKAAGAVPPDGSKKDYKETRNLFKSTTLGLQFGMGVKKLALKLSTDTGKTVTVDEAQKLVNLHKRIFKGMWAWRDRIIRGYEHSQIHILQDGWALMPDNDSNMSTANFPVQGTGACIFREACRRAMNEKMHLIYGLHDALRVLCRVEDLEATKEQLLRIMAEAVEKYLGEDKIRNEGKTVLHGVPFLEEGSEAMYESMKQYLDCEYPKFDDQKIIFDIFS